MSTGGGGGRTAAGGGAGGSSSSGAPRSGTGMREGMAVPRNTSGTGSASGTGSSGATNAGTGSRTVLRDTGSAPANGGAPAYARPRDGQPVVGRAVPRPAGSVPTTGGTTLVVPGYYGGFYPWAFGGLGFYGYGYGTGFYDSWFDPYGYDPYGYDPYFPQTYSSSDTGGLRLKIKPSDATVYIDGYYVGVVDDYDGVFQKLSIEPGTHRVEIRAQGFETLSFDVRIEPGHTTTYRGELKKLPN